MIATVTVRNARRATARLALAAAALSVAACASAPSLPGLGGGGNRGAQPAAPVRQAQFPEGPVPLQTRGQSFANLPAAQRVSRPGLTPPFLVGQPVTRVGLMLPFSLRPQDAEAFANAAELAVFDQGESGLLLLPRDEGQETRLAEGEARALVRDGVDLIVGPLFGSNLAGAARAARDGQAPVIGFSTDRTLAGNGVYLLNFSIQEEVARVVAFAAGQNVRNIALLAPDDDYGRRVTAALQEEIQRAGGSFVAARAYPRTEEGAAAAAQALAREARGAQAVMIADNGPRLRALAGGLARGGLDLRRVKLLGTGEWAGPELQREPALVGGWFPAADPASRATFEQRYQAAYGKPPTRLAGLAYDAVALTAALTRDVGYAGLTRDAIERPDGFMGVDGPFRFRADGTVERGLAVMEVRPGGPQVVSPAPTRLPPLNAPQG